jgi:hypothetical protein
VEAFAKVRDVTREGRKGFGSGALKVNGRIFAMMSSKGQFVVKLPKQRVDELVSKTKGELFAPSQGRVMKEWVVIAPGPSELGRGGQGSLQFHKARQAITTTARHGNVGLTLGSACGQGKPRPYIHGCEG